MGFVNVALCCSCSLVALMCAIDCCVPPKLFYKHLCISVFAFVDYGGLSDFNAADLPFLSLICGCPPLCRYGS